MQPESGRRWFVGGVVAAAGGLAVAELVAAVLGASVSPVEAVGQEVIALTPGPIAEAIIGLVGTLDKPLAIVSVVLAVLLIGGLIGHWWMSRRAWSVVATSLLTVGAVLSVLNRPSGSADAVIAAGVGGAVLIACLGWLERQEVKAAPDDRRAFLRTLAGLGAAMAFVAVGGQLLATRRRLRQRIEEVRAAIDLPTRPVADVTGADLGTPGAPPWRSSNRDFYRIDTALTLPLIDPTEWSLRIHGMVERELTITYQDLIDRGLQDAWVTLCCVSNEIGGDLIGNAAWSGVPMSDLLAEVGVDPEADCLFSTSQDGWTCGTPLAAVTDGRDALLAVTMNGEPLPVPHGFPVRQVVPGLYGYVSATKWVVDWEVTRFADVSAYWTDRGWGERGPIKTGSRIDVPRPDAEVAAGSTTIAGVAWRQHVGIDAVEVRVDDGPWMGARLGRVPDADTWVQWAVDWDAQPGQHVLEVRATDANGEVQTADVADVLPDGATGHHEINVSVAR